MTLFINSNFIGNQYLGCFRMTLSSGQFWFTLFIVLVILLFPVVAIRFYNITVHPTLSDRCRMRQRFLRKKALTQAYNPYIRRKSSAMRGRRSIRSGYAFAHQEGFGKLITSGTIMKKSQGYKLNVPGRPEDSHHPHQQQQSRSAGGRGYKNNAKVRPVSYTGTRQHGEHF